MRNCFNNLSKVNIFECRCRPYFIDIFNYSNTNFPKKNVIICNADIIFDYTLHKLENNLLNNKIYALTRWDYIDEKTAKPRQKYNKIMHSSKDAWIFKTPCNFDDIENKEEFKKIQIGTWNCDGALNFFKRQNNYGMFKY